MNEKISLKSEIQSFINFPILKNNVPVIKKILISNLTYDHLEDLTLVIKSEPSFFSEFIMPIKHIYPDSSIELSPINLSIFANRILSLKEALCGQIVLQVLHQGNIIYQKTESIDMLPFNQWTGVFILPEFICSYIACGEETIKNVLKDACVFLEQWGFPSCGFTGYLTNNPDNVHIQIAAIFNALVKKHLNFDISPVNLTSPGIHIRFPYEVLETKIADNLNMSLTFAACLEASGLNPIIMFFKNKVTVGCWLENESFSECIQDNSYTIKKLSQKGINEICLIDCSHIFSGEANDFELSEKSAQSLFDDPENFLLAVDVKRSRASGIEPLNLVISKDKVSEKASDEKTKTSQNAPSKLMDTYTLESPSSLSKQQLWERKLLDLSLRNMLLNFRVMKNSIQIIAPNLSDLEDAVAEGKEFKIDSIPKEWEKVILDGKIFSNSTNLPNLTNIISEEFKYNRIHTFEDSETLDERMKHLSRKAKISIEENGSNTLFLALGFLKWYESDISQKARYAPLILIPIDITRKIQSKSYTIKMRDEEPQINITLLEYLKQEHKINIGGLDPLPLDESGINIPKIFGTIRKAILHKEKWQLEELSFIGLFSFSQYIMWNDLKNRIDDIEKNPIVSSLIQGNLNWSFEASAFSVTDMDKSILPSQLAIPLSADSSQINAIYASSKGESFVLHGPPGTGKSQTITNIIANALYNGKTVLFVAEKMAALSVVENRLNSLGLGDFCLQLHSNKTSKRSLLSQLEKAIHAKGNSSSEEFEKKADEIFKLRASLNTLIDELHKERSFGFSLYDAIVKYENTIAYAGKFKFLGRMVKNMDKETFMEWRDILYRIKTAGTECGGIIEHPLQILKLNSYSMDYKIQLSEVLPEYASILEEAKYLFKNISKLFNITMNANFDNLFALQKLALSLLKANGISCEFIQDTSILQYEERAKSIIQILKDFDAVKEKVFSIFDPHILSYDYIDAYERWIDAEEGFSLTRSMKQKKLIKELKVYTNSAVITKESIKEYYKLLISYSQKKHAVSLLDTDGKLIFKGLWKGENSNTALLEKTFMSSVNIIFAVKALSNNEKAEDVLLSNCAYILSNLSLANNSKVTSFISIVPNISHIEENLISLGVDLDSIKQKNNSLTNMSEKISAAHKNLSSLKAWTTLISLCNLAYEKGLEPVIDTYMNGKISELDLIPAFDCCCAFACAVNTINASSFLSRFQGAQFENTIKKYHEAVKEFENLTKAEIKARLLSRLPDLTKQSAASSETGILLKAIKNNGRMMSIRTLFDKIPHLLNRIAPCMLMSPISAAQYIDPAYPHFDLVIFDEASQLPTSEAVGAIARGKCAVIAGDPKQLPPTSFFATNRTDEENYDKEDLESILDDCIAISMPQSHLLWHYRSRHESLISYSNTKYYENQLYTFPSPNDIVSEVKLVHVDGFYDRGKTKQNPAEAKAVVDEIIRRLSDENLRKNSIGVVTFNINQQNLIDDLLAEELRKYPELEEYAFSGSEPIFIKNLENVQGDERDVILFSIGYGPDKGGNVTLNFGPLNQDGGWRRLNVAITRARKSMIVFSVLQPEQIDLSRTRSEGIDGLKGFLEFAKKGENALPLREDSDSSIIQLESIICEKIESLGYSYKTKIGTSKYKVDIGIIDPSDPDKYILGILLDGNTYKNAKTSRDRNILQPNILKSLGWNLHRIWILDWLDSPDKETEKLKKAIEKASENETNLNSFKETSDGNTDISNDFSINENTPELPCENSDSSTISSSLPSDKTVYEPFEISLLGKPDTFYQEKNLPSLRKRLSEIIKKESPISQKALFKKALLSWGISRSSPKAESYLERVSALLGFEKTFANNTVFYWKYGHNPLTYDLFRIPSDSFTKRNLDEIPPEEVASAIKYIIANQLSMDKSDLIRETAKIFGFTRLGNVIESSVKNGIAAALSRNYIKISEDENHISID